MSLPKNHFDGAFFPFQQLTAFKRGNNISNIGYIFNQYDVNF